jgi:hypothetical protein
MIDTVLHVVMWYGLVALAVVGGYVAGWASGRYRRLSLADTDGQGRRCRHLSCGNPALELTGYCHWHTSTMDVKKRRRLGLVPPEQVRPNKRKGAA